MVEDGDDGLRRWRKDWVKFLPRAAEGAGDANQCSEELVAAGLAKASAESCRARLLLRLARTDQTDPASEAFGGPCLVGCHSRRSAMFRSAAGMQRKAKAKAQSCSIAPQAGLAEGSEGAVPGELRRVRARSRARVWPRLLKIPKKKSKASS